MKIVFTILLIVMSCSYIAKAGDSIDYYWGSDSLFNFYDEVQDTLFQDNNFNFQYSHGWFPQPFERFSSVSFFTILGDINDHADNINPDGMQLTAKPYSSYCPASSREREIMFPNKVQADTGGYPQTVNAILGLSIRHNLNMMPAFFNFDIGVELNNGILFSEDNSRAYLSYAGNKVHFKELGIIHLHEALLHTALGLEFPVYGVFLETDDNLMVSYYYFKPSLGLSFALWSGATQYMQIADVKNSLRYGNGTDTLRLETEKTLDGLHRIRFNLQLEAGWTFTAGGLGVEFGFFYSVPLNSVIIDEYWAQYKWGIKMAFNSFFIYEDD